MSFHIFWYLDHSHKTTSEPVGSWIHANPDRIERKLVASFYLATIKTNREGQFLALWWDEAKGRPIPSNYL
jgi:hypothetical protein